MIVIAAAAVASLRARTGVSILECKKALEETGGDEEKAIDVLRKKGIASAAKKAGRDQKEGSVFFAEDKGKVALLQLDCETDFVARDEHFRALGNALANELVRKGVDALNALAATRIPEHVQKLGENISLGDSKLVEATVSGVYVHSNGKIGVVVGLSGGSPELAKDIAMHAAAMNPLYVRPEDVTEQALVRERDIWKSQLATEGKPAQILEKIMQGKEKKFREENALLTQDFVKDPGTLIKDLLDGADITAYERLAI